MSLASWWRSLWATPALVPRERVIAQAGLPLTDEAQTASGEGQSPPHGSARSVEPTAAMLRTLGWSKPDVWSAVLTNACAKHGITTRLRLAAFLANVGHETGGGARLVESLDCSADALTRKFGNRITPTQAQMVGRIPGKQPADQRAIGNIIYGGEWGKKNLGNTMPGDGWRFRGRGAMQTTGRASYQRTADFMGKPMDDAFLAWMETPEGAAQSAAYFWEWAKCHQPADAGDITRVRRILNGGNIGLEEVKARYQKALVSLGSE